MPELGSANGDSFYTVNDVTNQRAVDSRKIVYLEYQLWLDVSVPDENNASSTFGRLARETGVTPRRAAAIVDALQMLRHLPRFMALLFRLWHVDLGTVVSITQILGELDPHDERYLDILAEFDSLLTDYLTPTKPNEVVPKRRSIMKRMREWLKELDPDIAHGDKSTRDCESLAFKELDVGMTLMEGMLDPTNATVIQKTLHEVAAELGVTLTEALMHLVTGGEAPRVTLNVFSIDDEDSPMWMPGVGYLDKATEDYLGALITSTRNLNKVALLPSRGYTAPKTMQLLIKARDGVCMAPGCTRSAFRCDCDHIVNHADGGPTCHCNLLSLCRAHHNEKTEGRLNYTFNHRTCTAHFTFDDDSTASSHSEGPLSPEGIRWMRTVGQMRRARRERARERAISNTLKYMGRCA